MEYGTSQDSLDMTSDPTHSGEDITIANVTYSVTLSDLRENTTYYVQIVANNTAGRSNTTSMKSFMTLLAESGTFLPYVSTDPIYMQISFSSPTEM